MNLQEKYNQNEFIRFLKSFIPKYAKDIRRVDVSGLKVTKNAYYLGESPELDLSIFELTHMSSKDVRVALANDGFKIMRNSAVYRALVVYQAAKGDDWRLSLMTATPGINQKGKIVQTFSNPRRLSFFLGPDAKVRTPNDFLKKKGLIKDFDDLVSRFDVEIVTKEFFANYRKLYEDAREYLDKDHSFKIFASKSRIDIDVFAKRLLGQVVFCYFLQRKGWLGAKKEELINEGDKDFMRSLFKNCAAAGKNFYNDYLEYLFYDSLNKRTSAVASFFRPRFQCQIPFLNGGLFEPLDGYNWEEEFLYIPDKIFSNNDKTGILDIFDLYNFTVYEDDPIDREVSVDPEMLGKVFENLLPENLRKGKGTYYTPREIVHYMCQESLIDYLSIETGIDVKKLKKLIALKGVEENIPMNVSVSKDEAVKVDHALDNVKVCDPACGSGAFLVGMLNEIAGIRHSIGDVLNIREGRDEYHLKKQAIQNCIYGVDIDLGAVEIAKLRLWLSLVVDYNLEEVEPLPNLDYKIMCGNSLLEELVVGDEVIQLFDPKLLGKSLVASRSRKTKTANSLLQMTLFERGAEEYLKGLRELHLKYFGECDLEKKKIIRERIEKIELEFIKQSIQKRVKNIDVCIKNLNMQIPDHRKQQADLMKKKLKFLAIPNEIHCSKVKPYFLWKLNFFEVFKDKDGFDIVIANPPYFIEKDNRDAFNLIKNTNLGSSFYEGRMDYFYFFIEKTIRDLAKEKGHLTYITTNYWPTSSGAKKLRKYLKNNLRILKLVNFNEIKLFETAQGQHNLILLGTPNIHNNALTEVVIFNTDRKTMLTGDMLENKLKNPLLCSDVNVYKTSDLFDNKENLTAIQMQANSQEIRKKLEKNAVYLKESEIGNGIDILQEYVTKKHLETNSALVLGKGIFILTDKEYEELNLDEIESKIVKPFFETTNACKYWADMKTNKRIVYANKDFVQDINKYPNLRAHLDKYKKIMTSANKPYGLNRPRKEFYFKNEKILSVRMTKKPCFSIAIGDSYISRTFLVVKSERFNVQFLSAVLNSSLSYYWFYNYGKRKGNMLQIDKEPLMSFPIHEDRYFEKKIIEQVDFLKQVLERNKYKKDQCSHVIENKIDDLVYKLYALDASDIEEIKKFLCRRDDCI